MLQGARSKLQLRDQDTVGINVSFEIGLWVFHYLDTTCNSEDPEGSSSEAAEIVVCLEMAAPSIIPFCGFTSRQNRLGPI